ncbi:hypothetical protein PULV_a2785 [Pseudoalteromonas ulvae UL12]|nr:hypothetical protein [Pseudoalteromonas ulvae UL12]
MQISIVVALATTAKEGLALPPLWTHPAPPTSRFILQIIN